MSGDRIATFLTPDDIRQFVRTAKISDDLGRYGYAQCCLIVKYAYANPPSQADIRCVDFSFDGAVLYIFHLSDDAHVMRHEEVQTSQWVQDFVRRLDHAGIAGEQIDKFEAMKALNETDEAHMKMYGVLP